MTNETQNDLQQARMEGTIFGALAMIALELIIYGFWSLLK